MNISEIRRLYPLPTPKDYLSDKFYEFISGILLRGGLKKRWVRDFLKGNSQQEGYLSAFKVACVHKSISQDIRENMEAYELIGLSR